MSTETVAEWRGMDVLDRDGDGVGQVREIYLDQQTGQPEWLLVKTGLFGGKSTFVPIAGASPESGAIRVAYDGSQIKGAPKVDVDPRLSEAEERELYSHYGRDYGDGVDAGSRQRDAVGRDVSGPERLKKYVVTEHVNQTVDDDTGNAH